MNNDQRAAVGSGSRRRVCIAVMLLLLCVAGHELESDVQIRTEASRYSMGTPAQALAYKLGSDEMLRLRVRAQKELGKHFDIRQFHDWILGSGPLPLGILAEHVEWCIQQAKRRASGVR